MTDQMGGWQPPVTLAELHARILSEPFSVHVGIPKGYTYDEACMFKRLITEALIPVVQDAKLEIDSLRTLGVTHE